MKIMKIIKKVISFIKKAWKAIKKAIKKAFVKICKVSLVVGVMLFCLGILGCINPVTNLGAKGLRKNAHTNEMVDCSISKEFPRAMGSIIGQYSMDYGLYGIAGLLAILLGKRHIDSRKAKNSTKVKR